MPEYHQPEVTTSSSSNRKSSREVTHPMTRREIRSTSSRTVGYYMRSRRLPKPDDFRMMSSVLKEYFMSEKRKLTSLSYSDPAQFNVLLVIIYVFSSQILAWICRLMSYVWVLIHLSRR